jgi:hypothetical protein
MHSFMRSLALPIETFQVPDLAFCLSAKTVNRFLNDLVLSSQQLRKSKDVSAFIFEQHLYKQLESWQKDGAIEQLGQGKTWVAIRMQQQNSMIERFSTI